MTPSEIATIRGLTQYEGAGAAPPPEFPRTPEMPGGRYTDPRVAHLDLTPRLGAE